MIIIFVVGVISFLVVSLLWIISWLTHCPIIAYKNAKPTGDQSENKNELNEEQAAVTVATWTVLHPPS